MDNTSGNSQENQEELRYKALVESIGEGLIITDTQGQITLLNKAAESMLGWNASEAVGKHLQDVVKMEYHNGEHAEHTPGELNKFSIAEPLYFIRRDNTKFPVSVKTSSYVQGSQILGTITLFHDVTAEHNIDQMKTEFISLASHQLKTPLAAMRWYSEMLLSGDAGELTEQQLGFIDNIHTSMRRMNDLVSTLLNISRIESGRIKVTPKPTGLVALAEEVLTEVKTQADAKKRNISINAQGEIPTINIDPTLIRQVYLNLISNAVKYTPEGGNISVSLYKENENVVSRVEDNGYGIPEKEQGRIFDRFFRGGNVVMKEISGTGLGLYLTKSVVELSGGKIWFTSEEGKGTTFNFSLPVAGTIAKEGVVSLDA